jgi:hypothetical protein
VDFDFSYFDFFLVLALSDLGLHRGTAGIQARGYAESSETMKPRITRLRLKSHESHAANGADEKE